MVLQKARFVSTLFLVMISAALTGRVAADESALRAGDQVTVIAKEARLQLGKETVGRVEEGDVLTVTKVRGKWLGVRTDAVTGWIDSQFVQHTGGSVPIPPAQSELDKRHAIGRYKESVPGFAFSASHTLVGFQEGGKQFFEIDGKPTERYDDAARPVLSKDGEHWAYAARTLGKWWIVTDRARYGPYDGIGGCTAPSGGLSGRSVTFCSAFLCTYSRKGKKFGFAAVQSGKWTVCRNGKVLGQYPSIGINSLCFDPTEKRFAYWAQDERTSKWHLAIDGEVQPPPSDDLKESWCVFSPDGETILWSVVHDGRQRLVKNGTLVAEGTKVSEPVFNSDGSRWAAVIESDGRAMVMMNGEQTATYDQVVDGPVFSADGQHLALMALGDGHAVVVCDGKRGPEFTARSWLQDEAILFGPPTTILRFSPDSSRLAYAAKREDDQHFVVVDDQVYGPYESVAQIKFSPDSRHWGGIVQRGSRDEKNEQRAVVIDGAMGPWFDGARSLTFRGDGESWAYAAKSGDHWYVVRDGVRQGMAFSEITSLSFTRDGALLMVAATTTGKVSVFVDGVRGDDWDVVSPAFPESDDEGGIVRFLAVKSGTLYRVTRSTSNSGR